MHAGMGKDNRSWHRATQRSPQELAQALAALAADVGEPSSRQRPRRTATPPVREPWTEPATAWPERELEAESVPAAQDLRTRLPEPEPVHEIHAPADSLVESPTEQPEPSPAPPEPAPEALQPAPAQPEPVPGEPEPEPEALPPAPEQLQPDPEPRPGGLIVGRSLTGGDPAPAPPAQPTVQEHWDDGPPPGAGTPINARAAWTAQGVRSRAAGGRMRSAARPRLGPGGAAYRRGPGSRRGLIWLVAGVLAVVLVLIIALGSGGGSSKTSSTASVRQSAAATPPAAVPTVTIPPPATTATTRKHAAKAPHHAARLRAQCRLAKFRQHHPHICHVA